MKKLALFALPLALASCTMVGPTDANYTFARQAVVTSTAPAYAPAGTARVTERLGVTRTAITLSGMAPYAIYVAHYHKQGTAAPAATTSTVTTTTETATAAAPAAATPAAGTPAPGAPAPAAPTPGTAPGGAIAGGTVESPAATATTTDTAGAAPATNTAAQPAAVPAVNPCQSNGAPIMESKMVAQAGADGKVTLEGFVATALIQDATYLNVHTASDFNGTPADSGVVCTPVAIQ